MKTKLTLLLLTLSLPALAQFRTGATNGPVVPIESPLVTSYMVFNQNGTNVQLLSTGVLGALNTLNPNVLQPYNADNALKSDATNTAVAVSLTTSNALVAADTVVSNVLSVRLINTNAALVSLASTISNQTAMQTNAYQVRALLAGANVVLTTNTSSGMITVAATGSGGAAWGTISGTIGDQADLVALLNSTSNVLRTATIDATNDLSAAKQDVDTDLTAIANNSTSGLLAKTGSGTVGARTITGDAEITVSNGDGVSGNPTLAIAASLTRDTEIQPAIIAQLARNTNNISASNIVVATISIGDLTADNLTVTNVYYLITNQFAAFNANGKLAGTLDGYGWTNLQMRALIEPTNAWYGGTTISFTNASSYTNMAGNLTVAGLANINPTNVNTFLLICNANGSDRTVTIPAECAAAPYGGTAYTVTNGTICDVTIRMYPNQYTNAYFNWSY